MAGRGKDAPRPHPIGAPIPAASRRPPRASCRASACTEPGAGPHREWPLRPQRARAPGRRGPGTRRGRRSDHDRFVHQAAGLVQGPVLEGGDGAHAGRAAVLRQDHLRQRDRGNGRRPRAPPRRLSGSPRPAGGAGPSTAPGLGGARPGRDGTEGAGAGDREAAQARDWRLRGCHEARGDRRPRRRPAFRTAAGRSDDGAKVQGLRRRVAGWHALRLGQGARRPKPHPRGR